MRTTITLDDQLYQEALSLSDPDMDKSELFREAVKTYIRVQSAKRLAALGGTQPDMRDIPRRAPMTDQD
ncbi:MAG: type II toxin-antitoxin system VapB family antitoxin [Lautropia sp.]|nr:type II toxin-antitoxin system VapB family antitoxin [Lautropia sp.]